MLLSLMDRSLNPSGIDPYFEKETRGEHSVKLKSGDPSCGVASVLATSNDRI